MFSRALILIFINSLFTLAAIGQSEQKSKLKFYNKINLGYSFISGAGRNDQVIENSNGTNTVNLKPFSYGKGLDIGYTVGTMFSPNIGTELCLSYLAGGNSKENNSYYETTPPVYYTIDQSIKYRSSFFRVNPAIVFAVPGKKITPYAKVGIILGAGSATSSIEEDVFYSNGKKDYGQFEWKYKGGKGFGYTSCLGIKLNGEDDVVSLFFELTHINMSGNFKNASRTKYVINGTSYLMDLDKSQKEVEFEDTITENTVQDKSKPTKLLKSKYSFDSVGFNFGFLIPL